MLNTPAITILEAYSQEIQSIRSAYVGELSQLPDSVAEIATAHLQLRTETANGPLLGEIVPLMVAEVVGSNDKMLIDEFTIGWLYLYYSILMLDDTIDEPELENRGGKIITSTLMFEIGVSRIFDLVPNNTRHRIHTILARTASAGINELKNRDSKIRSTQFQTSLDDVADKLAVLNVCVEALLGSADLPQENSNRIQEAFSSLTLALQLLDDLQDLKSDFFGGLATYPIRKISDLDSIDGKLDFDKALVGMLASGSLVETVQVIQDSIIECRETLGDMLNDSPNVEKYLRRVELNSGLVIKKLDDISRDVDKASTEELSENILRSLSIVAQGS